MPAEGASYLDSWIAALGKQNGVVLAIQAFFDETWRHKVEPRYFAVAAVAFQIDGLQRFDEEWSKKIVGLRKPFRSASCFGGNKAFEDHSEWPRERRMVLLNQLADLSAQTRLAAFVVDTTVDDFDAYIKRYPNE